MKWRGKGSAFERLINKQLSLWISYGEHDDVFRRNVSSGGRFTKRATSGQGSNDSPGDAAANHPLAYKFLEHFALEYKFRRTLELDRFLAQRDGYLQNVWDKHREQCVSVGVRPLVVAKQNNRPILVLMDLAVSDMCLHCGLPDRVQFGKSLALCTFPAFLEVAPNVLLKQLVSLPSRR